MLTAQEVVSQSLTGWAFPEIALMALECLHARFFLQGDVWSYRGLGPAFSTLAFEVGRLVESFGICTHALSPTGFRYVCALPAFCFVCAGGPLSPVGF